MFQFIQDNLQWIITSIIAPVIAFFAGRDIRNNKIKKDKEEIKANSISNLESNLNIYQEMIDDLRSKFQDRISELEEDLNRLRILNEESRKVISRQEKFISNYRQYIDKLEAILTKNNIKFNKDETR